MKKLEIDVRSSARPAVYALDELKKYLKMMDGDIEFAFGTGGITLEVRPGLSAENPEQDDAVDISVASGKGVIAGSNPRALLIAAYRFLTELGARFLKPGKDGEVIPSVCLEDMSVCYAHAASYRHRGVCIEGAVAVWHMLDMVEWLPKVGMNSYFTQFITPACFFQRYYGHEHHAFKQPERLTKTILAGFIQSLEDSMAQRGLMYHAVGHGWTCEPFGVPGPGWYVDNTEYPPETLQYFAELGGKRALYKGEALNTNLCYSNEEARAIVTDAITKYCAERPGVDVLHFWLADGSNNHCECENCKDTRPADFYVQLLNELDEKMTRAGLPTRVVFLIYCDLLWAPERVTLKNKDRFILMFAPISRKYSQCMEDDGSGKMLKFERNKLKFPENVPDTIVYLKEWQEKIPGCDSFIFDYHFMWDYIREPGSINHAETLFKDMANLEKLALNGMISCQNQRVFFPSPLGMQAMAAALWDKEADFDAFKKQVLADSFGSGAATVEEYLTELTRVYPSSAARREEPLLGEKVARRFSEAEALCARFRPLLLAAVSEENACVAGNFRTLLFHNELTRLNARLFAFNAREDRESAKECFAELTRVASEGEDANSTEFDLALYLQTVGGAVGLGKGYPMPEIED